MISAQASLSNMNRNPKGTIELDLRNFRSVSFESLNSNTTTLLLGSHLHMCLMSRWP